MDTLFKKPKRSVSAPQAGTTFPHIFVSHSAKDNEFGERLVSDLQRAIGDADAVWYDVSGLQGGDEWWDKIVEELTISDIFIIVLSPDSVVSHWVRRELNTAINEGKRIIPVLYQPCQVRADLKTIQMISFLPPKDYETAFDELLTTLGLPKPESPLPPSVQTAPGSSDSSTGRVATQAGEAPTVDLKDQASAGSEAAAVEGRHGEKISSEKPVSRRGISPVHFSLPKFTSRVSPVRIAILAGLAVLLIAAGIIGFSLFSGGNQGQQAPGNATTTANAQLTATSQANATPASTIEAQIYATATAIAYAPTQTAIDDIVTASGNHFPPHLGTLALNDPLRDNTQGHGWDENVPCAFTGGTYHVSGSGQYTYDCLAKTTNFDNFAFQVQMTIIKGDCGGLAFRGDGGIGFYAFEVCTDGTYSLAFYTTANVPWLISPTPFAAINTHLNQTNVLAVIANGSKFDLYINQEHVTSIRDSTYSHGSIGVAESPNPSDQSAEYASDVAFSNAKVWTF
jgi:TIR domain